MNGTQCKLMISNLTYGITDNDLRELFGIFGPLRKLAVHYDQSGRSCGSAEVNFFNSRDCRRAAEQCNGMQLDGRPIRVFYVPTSLDGARDHQSVHDRVSFAPLRRIKKHDSVTRISSRASRRTRGRITQFSRNQVSQRIPTTTTTTFNHTRRIPSIKYQRGANTRTRRGRGGRQYSENGKGKALTAEELDKQLNDYQARRLNKIDGLDAIE